MKTISRYIMTLALLITAVGGAWAQDYYIDVNFNSYYNRMETHFHCAIMNQMDPEAEIKGTLNLSVDGVSKGSFNVDNEMFDGDIAPVDAGNHTWSAVFSPVGGGSFNGNGNFTIDKLSTSIIYDGSTSINMVEGESTELVVYVAPDGTDGLSYSSSDASVASIAKKEYSNDTYIIQAKAAGTATITFSFAENTNYKAAEEDVTITVTVLPAPIKVTTNAAEEGATFTEATFAMPPYDATADYELVRDLAQQTSVNLIIGTGDAATPVTADTRLRIVKDNNVYVPISALSCTFSDEIEGNTILPTGFNDAKLTPQFYLQGENDAWTLVTDINTTTKLPNNLQPGQVYCITLKADDGSCYDGETQPSFTVTLFEGYEVAVPAGEYVTYFRDEPLYADPVSSADAKLYTVSSVSNDQAVLSSAITTAPSNTPLLVYNAGNTDQTFLLIPADAEPNLALTVAPEFIGTTEATTIAASTSTKNNYALNGKQFVWVKDALAIAANKAYLSVTTLTGGQLHAPALSIVFGGDTTSIANTNLTNLTNDAWYDLNGRKLNAKPTTKGVYIMNGRKVVVK